MVIARDVVGLVGICLISFGAWLVYPPAGYMVLGAFLTGGALILGARK